jgi:hypothetical protein
MSEPDNEFGLTVAGIRAAVKQLTSRPIKPLLSVKFFEYCLDDGWYRFYSSGCVERIIYDDATKDLTFYILDPEDGTEARERLKKEIDAPRELIDILKRKESQ